MDGDGDMSDFFRLDFQVNDLPGWILGSYFDEENHARIVATHRPLPSYLVLLNARGPCKTTAIRMVRFSESGDEKEIEVFAGEK